MMTLHKMAGAKAEGVGAMGATSRVAGFAALLDFRDLPGEVVTKLKSCLLDTITCVVLGNGLPGCRILLNMAFGEEGKARMWGTSRRGSAFTSALVNGAAAHSFQFDEVHAEAVMHPGSAVTPAIGALAETGGKPISGKSFLAAMAAGYECGIRIGMAAEGRLFERGWHGQGVVGPLAAAVAASNLLHLGAKATGQSLGIAASYSGGPMAVQEGAMAKALHSGRAAEGGLRSALLACNGYSGIKNVLETPFGGFFGSFAGGFSPTVLSADLGERWHLLDVSHKPVPAANASIAATEALLRILSEQRLGAADITAITAFVSTNSMEHCGWAYDVATRPSVLAAQMNLRYGLAVTALDGCIGAEQFRPSRIWAADVAAFLPRVGIETECIYDRAEAGLRLAARVRLATTSGKEFEAEVRHRRGTPLNPMSASDIREKYNQLVIPVLGDKAASRLASRIDGLEQERDVGEVLADLATRGDVS